jgi:uncharacterized protein YndB with AHSA1/START domain
MPDILHDYVIEAPASKVFDAVATPRGLDAWWTLESAGEPRLGAVYRFYFGPQYDWRGVVREVVPAKRIEWEFTDCDDDWRGTRLSIRLEPRGATTGVVFAHRGWKEENAHFRTSTYCWAMYLRLLRRYVENGEVVEYDRRLDV